jgi:hypothetical protein
VRTTLLNFSRALAAAAFLAGPFSAAAAMAGGLYQEHVHADSFGNLVIYSPAGYKRIVVGQGYLAEALKTAQAEAARPHHLQYPHYNRRDDHRYSEHCNRQPVLLHGRSYMYGLPDNVVPVPAGICH